MMRTGSLPWIPYALAFMLNIGIAASVWPGFMSWDSLYALSQARYGITSVSYPPLVSYLWRLVEYVLPGQGGMLLLENGALLFGLAHLLVRLHVPTYPAFAFMIAFSCLPAVLGPMLVLWKDVLLAGSMLLALSFALQYRHTSSLRSYAASIFCLTLAAAFRLNALPAVLPVLAWLCRPSFSSRANCLKSASLFLIMSCLIASSVLFLLTWRLPDFQRLPPQQPQVMTQIFDLLGISICAQQVLLPPRMLPPEMTIDELNELYRPEHVQKAFGIEFVTTRHLALSGIPDPSALNPMWIGAILEHPSCYLWHRARVAQFMVGANREDVFYVTHPDVDANDLGVSATPSAMTKVVVNWVLSNSRSPITRVWVYLAVGTVCLAAGILFHLPNRDIAVVAYLSGASYTLASIPLVPAADLRYQLWTVVAMLAASISVVSGVFHRGRKLSGVSRSRPDIASRHLG